MKSPWTLVWLVLCLIAGQPGHTNSIATGLNAHFPTSLVDDPNTQQRISVMLTRGRTDLLRSLQRLEKYQPQINRELEKRQLPAFLLYLPLAESRAIPGSVSSAGAAGLWQLMPATARSFGLEVSARKDERVDPARSTYAALELLRELHEEFQDWALTLAAYNCGPSRVRRLLRQTGADTYLEIRPFLPRETRVYLPRFLAYAAIAADPVGYGLISIKKQAAATRKDEVRMEPAPLLPPKPVVRSGLERRLVIPVDVAKPLPVKSISPVASPWDTAALVSRQRLVISD